MTVEDSQCGFVRSQHHGPNFKSKANLYEVEVSWSRIHECWKGKLKNLIFDQARAVIRAASFSRLRTRTIKKGKTLCV